MRMGPIASGVLSPVAEKSSILPFRYHVYVSLLSYTLTSVLVHFYYLVEVDEKRVCMVQSYI